MNNFAVIKRNILGKEVFRYAGRTIEHRAEAVLIEAYFGRPDMPFHGLTFGQGDRMLEVFYARRWYNIFEIHDREDDHLKGWYCNVARPAEINEDHVAFIDLALDLLVFPDGRQLVLDEDEFEESGLEDDIKLQARNALEELKQQFLHPEGFRVERDWRRLI